MAKPFPRFLLINVLILLAGLLLPMKPSDARIVNALPAAAAQALHGAGQIVLYSLEPWEQAGANEEVLYRFKVLGRKELDREQSAKAVAELEAAIAGWDGMVAMCFDPRHALRVKTAVHTYDYLLCYACHQLYVYEDGKLIKELGAAGSAKVLNELLSAAKIPLSKTDTEEDRAARQKAFEDAEAGWRAAMPKSIVPLWENVMRSELSPDLGPLRFAIAKEFPDPRQRSLALFAWFGSGEGPWSGFPSYESIAEELLLDLPTAELIAAAQTEGLSERQLEGAARLFGGWEFGQRRPNDRNALPAALKKELLDHSLKSTDEDKLKRARYAFEADR
ncbi:MAG TPA: hypothetical protein VGX68_00280 [Thermoanaerobaculia bacterium]|jgi:hypothetical protein|nr:hypothetical protein [Thermoanaerobaculia bacterium]